MLRKRLIFTLIYSNGYFMQSRNFRLQKVGNLEWLEKNYNIQEASKSLDELIILNASRAEEDFINFIKIIKRISQKVYIPVSAGGKITKIDHIESLFKNGADKIVFNSTIYKNPDLVKMALLKYGSQSIIASIDYKKDIEKIYNIYINNGQKCLEKDLFYHINKIEKIGFGEIYINSIDQDGTGFGYDFSVINTEKIKIKLPLIFAGGAGNHLHLKEGLIKDQISAVATANLFNFMHDGLVNARDEILKAGINLANWK